MKRFAVSPWVLIVAICLLGTSKNTAKSVLAYTYHPDGNVKTLKGYSRNSAGINLPPGGNPDVDVGYGYDCLGRLAWVTNNAQLFNDVTTYHYDRVGNLDHFIYANGLKHSYNY